MATKKAPAAENGWDESPPQEFINYPIFNFEKIGDEFGPALYLGPRTANFDDGEGTIHDFQTGDSEDDHASIWGKVDLSFKLQGLEGRLVKITYTGNERQGKGTVKRFSVLSREA